MKHNHQPGRYAGFDLLTAHNWLQRCNIAQVDATSLRTMLRFSWSSLREYREVGLTIRKPDVRKEWQAIFADDARSCVKAAITIRKELRKRNLSARRAMK
jgi:hypothetical protein